MLLEIHILQNFAPSNLNRDDTGSPKDCTFGGFRRARISSQCLKRAARTHDAFSRRVGDSVGTRTKLLAGKVAEHLTARGHDAEKSIEVATLALSQAGYGFDAAPGTAPKTKVLLFVSPGEIARYAEIIGGGFEAIAGQLGQKKPALDKALLKELKGVGSSQDAADIALFGRMVAESTNLSVDAACQVAHAISTHAVDVEMDFYTAVDDLQPKEETGAGMMGIIEFNSACFYRYSAVHFGQLLGNLHGDRASAVSAALGFVEATIAAIPSGKQNSMAAHNPPSYVRVKVRDGGAPWSLSNAFARPVRVGRRDDDLMRKSIEALEEHDDALAAMYGATGVVLDKRASLYPDHHDLALSELSAAIESALR